MTPILSSQITAGVQAVSFLDQDIRGLSRLAPSLQRVERENEMSPRSPENCGHLPTTPRTSNHLAVVDLDSFTSPFHTHEVSVASGELYMARVKTDLKAWKKHPIGVLKDSCAKRASSWDGRSTKTGERGPEVFPQAFL